MMKALLCSVISFLAMASVSRAGDCDGDDGWELTITPPEVPIGGDVEVCLKGPVDSMAFFMVSLGDGPTTTLYGDLCVDFPLLTYFIVNLGPTGEACFDGHIPCDPQFVGLLLFTQFVTCHPHKGRSNGATLLITDGICDGDFCSFTQGGWGQECNGGNVGCLRDGHFADVFPNGLILGDQDGVDGDGAFALVLTSAKAVEDFLPAGSTAGVLTEDLTDPTSSPAGVLAGQLASAKLNVAFADADLFDGHGHNGVLLGDLVYVGCVDDDLIGLSVRDVIDLADELIAGDEGDGLDLDGDGTDDVGASDLSDALGALNENFDECSHNNGCLGLPN